MSLWFYLLPPIGWFCLYLTLSNFFHEFGHLVVGLLTGHKITRFKVGLGKPIIQFQIRGVPFEFSLDGMGGAVSCDKEKSVSQIGIFLTAMAGPCATLLFATAIFRLSLTLHGENHGYNTWQYICQVTLFLLAGITYLRGLCGIVADFKNILIPKS